MKWQRCGIASPGESTSTMNAVICLRSLPFTIFGGVFAMTTSTPAFSPLVHQSFLAIQDELGAIRRRVGAQTHRGRIGPGVRFRERKGRDLVARHARQIFLFLLLRAEKQQRLRHADRLMGGDERGQVCVPTAEQHRGPAIIHLRQTEAAVLLGNLDRESAHREEVVDILLRDFAGAIDFIGVHVRFEISPQFGEKPFARGAIFGALLGERKDAVEIVAANEEVAREAAAFIERITGTFRQIERRGFPRRHLRSIDDRRGRRLRAGFFSDLFFRCFER